MPSSIPAPDARSTIYVSIGNSDDKLPQVDWSNFVAQVTEAVHRTAEQIFGVWHSGSTSPYQNACIAFEITPEKIHDLKTTLNALRMHFRQDSIAWAVVPETEFI